MTPRARLGAVAAALVAATIVGCSSGHPTEGITGPPTSDSGSSQSACTGIAVIIGSSVTTSLGKNGCANGSLYQDLYTLYSSANTPLDLTASSTVFPVHLSVIDLSGHLIADSSVAAGATGVALRLVVPAGQYRIYVGSIVASTGGIYALNAAAAPTDVGDCTRVFVAPSVVMHQQIVPTDCRIGTAAGDQYLLHLNAGQSAKIVWDDFALQAVTLRVFGPDGSLLSSGLSSNPSTTTITASQSGYYLLQFTYGASGTANYEFAIQ